MSAKKQWFTAALTGILLCAVFLFQNRQAKEPLSRTAFKLNTIISITLYDSDDRSVLDKAFALCDRYEQLFSRTLETGELYRLNNRTLPEQDGTFTVSHETAELISKGLYYSELSDGGFDLTIAPVSSLWDFTAKNPSVPSREALARAAALVDYRSVILSGDTVRFRNEQTMIDAGAIAKGYIADRIKELLVSEGIKSAMINLGGNILCIGSAPDGRPFDIGIQKPFGSRSETAASLAVSDRSVVTSGVYERFFEKNGKLYHHLLNPETGYPYDNSLLSVTVISEKSVDGDGLSTACFALGLEKGMKLIDSLADVSAVFITKDGRLHYSRDFSY